MYYTNKNAECVSTHKHIWAYPEYDSDKNRNRVCICCGLKQTKVWKNEHWDSELEDDK